MNAQPNQAIPPLDEKKRRESLLDRMRRLKAALVRKDKPEDKDYFTAARPHHVESLVSALVGEAGTPPHDELAKAALAAFAKDQGDFEVLPLEGHPGWSYYIETWSPECFNTALCPWPGAPKPTDDVGELAAWIGDVGRLKIDSLLRQDGHQVAYSKHFKGAGDELGVTVHLVRGPVSEAGEDTENGGQAPPRLSGQVFLGDFPSDADPLGAVVQANGQRYVVFAGITRGATTLFLTTNGEDLYFNGEDPARSSDGMVMDPPWSEADEIDGELAYSSERDPGLAAKAFETFGPGPSWHDEDDFGESAVRQLVNQLVEDEPVFHRMQQPETDPLEAYFQDVVYDEEKERTRDLDRASQLAADRAPKYAQSVKTLLGDGAFGLIVGGSADGAGFSLDLKDGSAVTGNANGARFLKAREP